MPSVLRLLRRHAVPVAVAVPIAVAGLLAGDGSLPRPLAPDESGVAAVPVNGRLGGDSLENPLREADDLSGAHPVSNPVGTSAIRQAAAREGKPSPTDVSDLALPARVLEAYQAAARQTGRSDAGCHLGWPLLAGIGKVESGHAYGGAVDRRGDTLTPILGPVLDGGPGVAAIPDTDDGRWDTDETWDRAVGPMQFIPSSWTVHGEDGNGDGRSDPNNVTDAALASAGYLCSGERDVSVKKQRRQAVYSYNHSWDYVDLVLAWADAYAGGTPVLTGSLGELADDDPRRAAGDRSSADGSDGASDASDSGAVAALPAPGPTPDEPADGGTVDPPADGPAAAAPEPVASSSADPGEASPEPTTTPTEQGCPTPTESATPSPTDTSTPTVTPTPEETTPTPDPTESPSTEPTSEPTETCPIP